MGRPGLGRPGEDEALRRLHLFEIEDQPWCPAVLRDGATAYLRRSMEVTGHARLLAPKLAEVMRASGTQEIVDLCSGGAGPLPALLGALAEECGIDACATLTDRYPNLPALRAIREASGGRIDFVAEPVEATRVPRELRGVRTLFNALHHFRPDDARRVLRDAASQRQPLAAFELVGRQPALLLGILLAPLGVLLLMPTVRPLRAPWLLFTYLVPLIPLLVLWDGIVSCLRVYSERELGELVDGLGEGDYAWEAGRVRLGLAPAYATYLIGRPSPRARA